MTALLEAVDRVITAALQPPSNGIEIKNELPPNYKDIIKVFPVVKTNPGVIFTYGKTIYNPGRVKLSRALYEHECVHSRRQVDPVLWWADYLVDPKFRLAEELVAHQVEYMTEVDGHGRQVRRRTLAQIAERLSGPLYGKMISKSEAKSLIQGRFIISGDRLVREEFDGV